MQELPYHIPALLDKAIEYLEIKPGGTYVDVTFGGGGHSRAILDKLNDTGHLYGFDQDEEAVAKAFKDPRFTIVHSNFRYLSNFLRFYGVEQVDGIIADLGVSFHHFDDADRGFSFRWDSPLDMRMNRKSSQTALKILSDYDVEKLTEIFRIYGELHNARKIATAIVTKRQEKPIVTTFDLLETIKPYINPKAEKKELSMVFQALRIEVNHEMDTLQAFLNQAIDVLSPSGRLVVITYHSLEDRMVKNFMKYGNLTGTPDKDFFGIIKSPLKPVNSKPIVPTESEIENNPRSRSAKMRVAVKMSNN